MDKKRSMRPPEERGEDLVKMLAVLRSVQLGITSKDVVCYAIDNRGQGLDVEDVVSKVKDRLKSFGR